MIRDGELWLAAVLARGRRQRRHAQVEGPRARRGLCRGMGQRRDCDDGGEDGDEMSCRHGNSLHQLARVRYPMAHQIP